MGDEGQITLLLLLGERRYPKDEPRSGIGIHNAAVEIGKTAEFGSALPRGPLPGLLFGHPMLLDHGASEVRRRALLSIASQHGTKQGEVMHESTHDACYGPIATISLRNLPPDVEKAILEKSRSEKTSLNRATAMLLEAATRKPPRNSDFDELAGSWTAERADEFDAILAQMRRVDPADWAP